MISLKSIKLDDPSPDFFLYFFYSSSSFLCYECDGCMCVCVFKNGNDSFECSNVIFTRTMCYSISNSIGSLSWIESRMTDMS